MNRAEYRRAARQKEPSLGEPSPFGNRETRRKRFFSKTSTRIARKGWRRRQRMLRRGATQ
jgi:hypothetical protein